MRRRGMAVPVETRKYRNPRKPRTRPFVSPERWIRRGLLLLLLGAAILLGARRANSLLTRSSLFLLKDIEAKGLYALPKERVIAVSGLEIGRKLFEIDLKETGRRIREEPIVKDVVVSRRLPDRILLSIQERRPVALINLDKLYGVDHEGVLLPFSPRYDLPILTSIRLEWPEVGKRISDNRMLRGIRFLQRIRALDPDLVDEISEIKPDIPGDMVLHLVGDGLTLKMSEEGLPRQMAVLRPVLTHLSGRPAYVDLRFVGQVAVGW